MLHCKHCDRTFPDARLVAFCRHLENEHGIEPPYCLGNHGYCDTAPKKITSLFPPEIADGTALQP